MRGSWDGGPAAGARTAATWREVASACAVIDAMAQGLADDLAWDPAAPPSSSAAQWAARLTSAVGSPPDLVTRAFVAGRGRYGASVVFLDGMVDGRTLDQDVIAPLQHESGGAGPTAMVDRCLAAASVRSSWDLREIIAGMLGGDTALCVDGAAPYLVDAKGFKGRSPEQPTTERSILGSKEAFVETLRTNTTMIRRRVQSRHPRILSVSVGRLSPSQAAVA